MEITKAIHIFNESAFGEIDILLDTKFIDASEIGYMVDLYSSALNCLQIAEWLTELRDIKNPPKKKSWIPSFFKSNQYEG